jgi:hypothetical protein
MDNIKTNFDNIATALNDASEIFKNTANGIDTFINCKIIRNEMRNTAGNICFKFGKNFTIQGVILAIIGILFWILSCCVCKSFQQSKAVRKIKELQKQEYKDNKKKEENGRPNGHNAGALQMNYPHNNNAKLYDQPPPVPYSNPKYQ